MDQMFGTFSHMGPMGMAAMFGNVGGSIHIVNTPTSQTYTRIFPDGTRVDASPGQPPVFTFNSPHVPHVDPRSRPQTDPRPRDETRKRRARREAAHKKEEREQRENEQRQENERSRRRQAAEAEQRDQDLAQQRAVSQEEKQRQKQERKHARKRKRDERERLEAADRAALQYKWDRCDHVWFRTTDVSARSCDLCLQRLREYGHTCPDCLMFTCNVCKERLLAEEQASIDTFNASVSQNVAAVREPYVLGAYGVYVSPEHMAHAAAQSGESGAAGGVAERDEDGEDTVVQNVESGFNVVLETVETAFEATIDSEATLDFVDRVREGSASTFRQE